MIQLLVFQIDMLCVMVLPKFHPKFLLFLKKKEILFITPKKSAFDGSILSSSKRIDAISNEPP